MKYSMEQLQQQERLCDFCPIPAEVRKGVHTPSGYQFCEGSSCADAYAKYCEQPDEEEDEE